MATIKSVHFSPILEHVSDDVSTASSDVGLSPNETKFEDAYIASLSKSAKKYHLPTEDKQSLLQRRKKALLAFGFVLLLSITGVVIYLVTRELSNMESYSAYSEVAGERVPKFASRNTSLHHLTITMDSLVAKSPSLEYSKTPSAVYSDSITFRPSTIVDTSSLGKSSETKYWKRPSYSTPSLAALRKTPSPSVFTWDSSSFHSNKRTVHLYFATQRSQWEDEDPITTSIVSSVSVTRSTLLDTIFNVSFKQKISFGTAWSQNTRTLVKGLPRSSYPKYILYTYSFNIGTSSNIERLKRVSYSKSKYSVFQPETNIGEYTRSAILAGFTSHSPSSSSKSKNSVVKVITYGINMETTTILPITKSSVFSYLTNTRMGNYFTEDLSLNISDKVQASSKFISQQPTTSMAMGKKTQEMLTSTNDFSSSVQKIHSDHYHSLEWNERPLTAKVSTPSDVPFSSLSKDQFAPSSSKFVIGSLIQKQSSKKIFKVNIMKTPFPSSSFIAIQKGSTSIPEIRKTAESSSLFFIRQSDSSQMVPRQTTLITYSHFNSDFASPKFSIDSRISTDVKVRSIKITESPQNHLQTDPSRISTPSLDTALLLMTKISNTVLSLPVTLVSPHSSTSSHTYQSIRPLSALASKSTIKSTGSSLDFSQNIMSYNSPSTLGYDISSASTKLMSKQTSNTGFSIIPFSSVHLPSEVSTTESPSASTLFGSKFLTTSMQTSNSGVGYRPQKSTVTGLFSTPILSSKPSTVSLPNQMHFSRSLSMDEVAKKWMSSKARDGEPLLSSFISSDGHPLMNKAHEISQHLTLKRSSNDFSETKTVAGLRSSSNTTPLSPRRSLSSFVGPGRALRTATLQETNAWYLSVATSSSESWDWKSNSDSLRTRGSYVSTVKLQKPFRSTTYEGSSKTWTNLSATEVTINTGPLTVPSMVLSLNRSLTSHTTFTSIAMNNLTWNVSIMVHSLNATADKILNLSPEPDYTSTSQVRISKTADYYLLSSVMPTFKPTFNSSSQFQIMDGSLIIKNRNFHANLSNPNSTMFKVLAEEVERIIEDIVSVDAKVIYFKEGSVIAFFYLRVARDSPYKDSTYAKMLSDANESLWRGYDVANITVTLRVNTEHLSEKNAALQDNGGLSKAVFVAIFTVLSVLLMAVGGFGVYICAKKGYFERGRVKPADSPIPPSELEKIQPVRRGTWVMNDEPFLNVDVPKDPNYRSTSFYETLSMGVVERNETQQEKNCNPILSRKATRSPFEPTSSNSEEGNSATGNACPSTSRSMSDSMTNLNLDGADRPVSGSSRSTYLNIAVDSTHSEDEC